MVTTDNIIGMIMYKQNTYWTNNIKAGLPCETRIAISTQRENNINTSLQQKYMYIIYINGKFSYNGNAMSGLIYIKLLFI